jgi:hypothetical protein
MAREEEQARSARFLLKRATLRLGVMCTIGPMFRLAPAALTEHRTEARR